MKKFDLILIGPQMAGKTALLRTFQKKEPIEHTATQSNGEYTKVSFGNWFHRNLGKDMIVLDAGGKDCEREKYPLWCKEATTILFVFNGCEMLDEVKYFGLPGKNTSFCKKICSELEKDADIWFIATHKDKFLDKSPGEDLVASIQRALEDANISYGNLFPNMAKRYHPFSKLMKGRLFAVNALNEDEVKDLFGKIFEL